MYLIRKIDDTLWLDKQSLDAVSLSDLSTKDNDLSVWADDVKHSNKNEIALAYTLTQKNITDVCFIYIEDKELEKYGLTFEQEDSDTPYADVKKLHYNIHVPSFFEVGYVAEIINKLITEKPRIESISMITIKQLLYDRVKQDCIHMDFADKKSQAFADILRVEEKNRGKIDFSVLKNAKPYNNKPRPKVIDPACQKCDKYKSALQRAGYEE